MVKNKKEESENKDFLRTLVKNINKDAGSEITYLIEDGSPSDVKRWVSTGSSILDYVIANKKGGGAPIGKIIEIVGHTATGKSLIAQNIAKNAQKEGALVVYEDYEGTLSTDWCDTIGLDVNKNFVYAQPNSLEEGFDMIFQTLRMIDASEKDNKEPFPYTVIIFDSVAAAPLSSDLESEDVSPTANVGLRARVINKNLTTLRGMAGRKNVLLIFLNHLKMNIGAMGYTDESKFSTPGGKSIRYLSSCSLQVSSIGKIKNKDGDVVGIKTSVKTLKSRFGPGFRTAEFPIYFNRGIDNATSVLEYLSNGNGVIKAAGGSKGNTFHFKGEDKESGLNQLDWTKKYRSDIEFRTKCENLLESTLVRSTKVEEDEEVSIEAGSDEA